MNSLRSLIMSLAIIGLFSYAFLNFGYGLQRDNGVNTTILDDPYLKSFNSSIRESIDDFVSSSGTQLNSSLEEQAEEQQPEGALTLGSIFHILTTFGDFVLGAGLTVLTLGGLIGFDAVIQGVLISMLGLLLVLLAWRLWKIGG